MDHRCGERRPVGITVLLRRRGWEGWIVGHLEDLSISGAFIRAPRGSLPLHAQVRLEMSLSGDRAARLMHCNAMVARVGPTGVGLVFDGLAPAALRPLLRASRGGARPEARERQRVEAST